MATDSGVSKPANEAEGPGNREIDTSQALMLVGGVGVVAVGSGFGIGMLLGNRMAQGKKKNLGSLPSALASASSRTTDCVSCI